MSQSGHALRQLNLTHCLLVLSTCWLSACSPSKQEPRLTEERVVINERAERLEGVWVTEANGSAMQDPQTSGLVAWRGKLLSLSDRSAVPKQRLKLHIIEPNTGQLQMPGFPITLSSELSHSCFADYISDNPDLEALLVDPDDDSVFYTVTEDASMTELSSACKQRFNDTGSTDYPTVLVRLELQEDNRVLMTHARPVRFAKELEVGDFPNDGIEGLTIDNNRQLYLALEKDTQGNARVFQIKMGDDFWRTDDFADAEDIGLIVPSFDSGNHPINGIQYVSSIGSEGALVAAARNDDQLWVIYLDRQTPTTIIDLTFWAPTADDNGQNNVRCDAMELMDNASIEGVAVLGERLWLINDPWKRNYLKNIQCESNEYRYKGMSPLLFSLPINAL